MGDVINRKYPYQVWFSSLIIAPLLFEIATFLSIKHFDGGEFGFIIFAFGYGVLFSIPTFLIYLFSFYKLKNKSTFITKLLLSLIAIIGMLITIFLLYGKDAYDVNQYYAGLTFSIIYGVSILLPGFIFKLTK